jgi:hypothetical protein
MALWTPAQLGTAVSVWLDTLDPSYTTLNGAGTRVNQWRSKTANGFYMQGNGGPTVITRNGMTFYEGGQDYNYFGAPSQMFALLPPATADTTILYVGKLSSGQYSQTLRLATSDGTGLRSIGTVWGSNIGLPKGGNDLAATPETQASPNGNIVIGQWTGGTPTSTVWLDGGGSSSRGGPNPIGDVNRFEILTNAAFGAPVDNVCATVVINRLITAEERAKLEGWAAWAFNLVARLPANHPYKTAAPQDAAAPVGYTLAADGGVFNLAGSNAGLGRGFYMTAAPGGFTLSGKELSIQRNRMLLAGRGIYAATTVPGGFNVGRRLTAARGAFVVAANNASLRRGYRLSAAATSFLVTGGAAVLRRGFRLLADAASYILTTPDVATGSARRVAADTGVFQIAANDVGQRRTRALSADKGQFVLTAAAVGRRQARRIAALKATFVMTTNAVGNGRGLRLTAASSSYSVTGRPANLMRGYRLAAAGTAFSVGVSTIATGTNRQLTAAVGGYVVSTPAVGAQFRRQLAANRGIFNLTGGAVLTKQGRRVAAERGAFVAQAVPVGWLRSLRLAGEPAQLKLTFPEAFLRRGGGTQLSGTAFTFTGNAATVRRTRTLLAARGAVTFVGNPVSLSRGYLLSATGVTFTLTNRPATLRPARRVTMTSGVFSLTGGAASLRTGSALRLNAGVFNFTGKSAEIIKISKRSVAADCGAFSARGLPIVFFKTEIRDLALSARGVAYVFHAGDVSMYRTRSAPPRQTLGAARKSRVRGGTALTRKLGS